MCDYLIIFSSNSPFCLQERFSCTAVSMVTRIVNGNAKFATQFVERYPLGHLNNYSILTFFLELEGGRISATGCKRYRNIHLRFAPCMEFTLRSSR